jgi:hypothetical protein
MPMGVTVDSPVVMCPARHLESSCVAGKRTIPQVAENSAARMSETVFQRPAWCGMVLAKPQQRATPEVRW